MFYGCLMNIQGSAPDALPLPSPRWAEPLIVNSFSRHQKSDSGISQKNKITHDPLLPPPAVFKLYGVCHT